MLVFCRLWCSQKRHYIPCPCSHCVRAHAHCIYYCTIHIRASRFKKTGFHSWNLPTTRMLMLKYSILLPIYNTWACDGREDTVLKNVESLRALRNVLHSNVCSLYVPLYNAYVQNEGTNKNRSRQCRLGFFLLFLLLLIRSGCLLGNDDTEKVNMLLMTTTTTTTT